MARLPTSPYREFDYRYVEGGLSLGKLKGVGGEGERDRKFEVRARNRVAKL